MNGLCVRLKGRAGLLRIDVDFDTGGGPLVLAGRNGSGKTSVLRMILGLLEPVSGRISLGERVLFDSATGVDLALEERGLGYVPQNYGLFPHMSVLENVEFALGSQVPRAPRRQRREQAEAALQELELQTLSKRSVLSLSSGEKQRVALARALARKPRALLLDEPLAALDVGARREVRAFLAAYLTRLGLPALLVTHDPADAIAIGHRTAVLEAGRIAQIGSCAQLASEPASGFVAEFFGAVRLG